MIGIQCNIVRKVRAHVKFITDAQFSVKQIENMQHIHTRKQTHWHNMRVVNTNSNECVYEEVDIPQFDSHRQNPLHKIHPFRLVY